MLTVGDLTKATILIADNRFWVAMKPFGEDRIHLGMSNSRFACEAIVPVADLRLLIGDFSDRYLAPMVGNIRQHEEDAQQ